ncbi:hypothetical protein MML48_2g00013287 [Holotrichia oblita]|uniref:Uncharacterized protein n=1 Tax=Holotrichia oblita TaxID=644536 RepID=A0ACB9TLE0_HOLOL|nr:hypothetical protein MML48_2g00013287 [Holotrichia oblita]
MSNIKKRLKDAYGNVTFYANKTWTNDCYLYQKTNQELYARHIKIQEAFTEEVTRPRTVRDSIPQSKLAKYSNYVYDEARELSYTPNTNDIMFHYTCRCKDEAIEEPWMLPEVEQLFIWLTYSRDFNLMRYRDLVHFDPVDTNKTKHTCTLEDFYKVDPRFLENFERTPGKARFTKPEPLKDVDLKSVVPPILSFSTFDDMTVKMKFNLDSVKNLWKTGRSDDLIPPKKVEIFKSPFDNLFIDEDPKSYKYYFHTDKIPYHFNELQEKANDFRNLQGLTEMLKRIKEPEDMDPNPLITCRTASDGMLKSTPVKRLYSDVVQGLANKNSSKTQFGSEPLLIRSESFKDIRFPAVKLGTIEDVQYKTTTKVKAPANPPNWFDQSWGKHEIKLLQKPEEKKVDVSQAKQTSNSQNFHTKSFSSTVTNTDAFTNSPINCYGNSFVNYQNFCPTNSAVTEYQPADLYNTYNTANAYASNYYNPLQYPSNSIYCNSYTGANLATNPYAYSPVTYATQLTSCSRNFIQQKQNTFHYNTGQQQWIMHQYRTPSLYNINHIPPQTCFLLPPQLTKQQRWLPTGHYVRPPTPQTFHVNATPPHTSCQTWNVQGQLYRTNSTQHVCPQSQTFETSSLDNASRQKFKSRKINSQINIIVNKGRNKSPDNLTHPTLRTKCSSMYKQSEAVGTLGTSNIFANSNANDVAEYKVIVKKNSPSSQTSDINKALSSALQDFDSESKQLPVITTNSDDLERQALEEYQSSNESFYKDLERQAEEQYEDSENSLGPRINTFISGARIFVRML